MHRQRRSLQPVTIATLTTALWLAAPALAHVPYGPLPLVPGELLGPVRLGEAQSALHLGPSLNQGQGSFYYRDYSMTVVIEQGKVVGMITGTPFQGIPTPKSSSYVASGQYQTHTQPVIKVGVPISRVPAVYPSAHCKQFMTPPGNGQPRIVSVRCVLRSHHGGTVFTGGAQEGATVPLLVVQVVTAALTPPV